MLAWLVLGALAAAGSDGAVAKGKFCPHRIETKHFGVEFSVPEKVGQGYAELCEKAYRKFARIFDVEADEVVWEGACHVFLFQNRAEFVQFAVNVHGKTAALSGGYTTTDKKDPMIVLYLQGGDHTRLQQTLIHEMTHVFLENVHKKGGIKTWLHEGFAQYFEFQHKPDDSRLELSQRIAKALVRRNASAPLAQFWESYFPPTNLPAYAQAWSLVEFMASTKRLRQRTGKFIIAIKDGGTQQEALKEVFGVTLAQFEAMWKRHVLETY